MDCYVINLDKSADRWERFAQSFSGLGLNLIRVPAIEGKTIEFPHPEYSEKHYRLYHGKKTHPNEVGCFFSHLKALRTFLASDQEHALICEDDVSAKPELVEVLHESMQYCRSWDILRLNGLNTPFQVPVATLTGGYQLTVPLTWFGGAGAYMVNRKAAERLMKFIVPMRVPYDHALDQNWLMGLTAAMIKPYPIQLNETAGDSQIEQNKQYKLPFFQRYFLHFVLPYRGIMTLGRWGKQLSTTAKYLMIKPKPM